MKYQKENITDIVIILLLLGWGVYETFIVPTSYDKIVSIFIGICLSYLFPLCCKKTELKHLKIRYNALQYSFTVMIGFLCALKIVEILRNHIIEIDGIKVIFIGVFLQSVYFLIKKHKFQKANKN